MKVLHPENKSIYIGDSDRATLYVEITPPKNKLERDFIKYELIEFMKMFISPKKRKPKRVKNYIDVPDEPEEIVEAKER